MDINELFEKIKNKSLNIFKKESNNNLANLKIDYSSKKINMLPLNYYKAKRKRSILILVLILLIVSTTYFFYFLYQIKTSTLAYNYEVYSIESVDGYSGINEQISKLSEEKNSQNLIFSLKKRIDSKSKLLVDIEKNNKSVLYTLSVIEDELPNGIIFSSAQVDSEGQININGSSTNNKEIAILIHNLKETKYFNTVFVNNINYNEGLNSNDIIDISYSFSITCEFGGEENETE